MSQIFHARAPDFLFVIVVAVFFFFILAKFLLYRVFLCLSSRGCCEDGGSVRLGNQRTFETRLSWSRTNHRISRCTGHGEREQLDRELDSFIVLRKYKEFRLFFLSPISGVEAFRANSIFNLKSKQNRFLNDFRIYCDKYL